jgi:hypothetical protein
MALSEHRVVFGSCWIRFSRIKQKPEIESIESLFALQHFQSRLRRNQIVKIKLKKKASYTLLFVFEPAALH